MCAYPLFRFLVLVTLCVISTSSNKVQRHHFSLTKYCLRNKYETTAPRYNLGCICHCQIYKTGEFLYNCPDVTRPGGSYICIFCRQTLKCNRGRKFY